MEELMEMEIAYRTKEGEMKSLTVKMDADTAFQAAQRQARIIVGQRFGKLVNGGTYTLTAKQNPANETAYLASKKSAIAMVARAISGLLPEQQKLTLAQFEKEYPAFDDSESTQWLLS
jgi:hypothetical protein